MNDAVASSFNTEKKKGRTKREQPPPSDEVMSRLGPDPGNPLPNIRLFLDDMYAHPERWLVSSQGRQFYWYDRSCWPPVEDRILISELYAWFENRLYMDNKGVQPFAPNKVADLIHALESVVLIPADRETPCWLGRAGNPANEMVSCENGLVHWPTRTLTPHRPDYYVHHSVPFDFDRKAPPPKRWLAFLNELWPTDPTAIETLQEAFGYMLSGDKSQQKIFLLVGPKRGGKGTIARVLTRMFGRVNVAAPTLNSLATNFGLQVLIGKPVAVISDARMGKQTPVSVITERPLSISGEDQLTVDRKYRDPWTGYLPTRFLILSNELPRITDASGALASRFVVMVLQESFYGRENKALTDQLCEELTGIFNWSLDGLQRLNERGWFEQPVSSADAIQLLEDLNSPVSAFVRERCELGADQQVEIAALYKAYRDWCLANGHAPRTSHTFGKDLRSVRPEINRSRPRVGSGERAKLYTGINLRPENLHMGWAASHAAQNGDEDELGRVGRVPPQCNSVQKCTACDGLGCPTCQPERFGLPPKQTPPAASADPFAALRNPDLKLKPKA